MVFTRNVFNSTLSESMAKNFVHLFYFIRSAIATCNWRRQKWLWYEFLRFGLRCIQWLSFDDFTTFFFFSFELEQDLKSIDFVVRQLIASDSPENVAPPARPVVSNFPCIKYSNLQLSTIIDPPFCRRHETDREREKKTLKKTSICHIFVVVGWNAATWKTINAKGQNHLTKCIS